ncbi:MDR family MFS transporter [Cutibacterium modestum]|uniref:MFS transporter n=2 Tax=Cutibacterium modestum TaxID=2559073 RepID=A0AAD1NVT1_9ACTN|nr:MDR family MFS transporter [Cutibacterium modestum]AOH44677.1 MFS transporter permease [Cutibacterium modestum]EFS75085.1 drug resistance MFS transporter, drug:H+ antiporter-2 family [Cutibacterium modestum HL037PA2]EFS91786.1 drug resistance MFS transporter, drug:H+ antiporter-2 family [Cutibacterium modestum HL044PA1]EFT15853.1 drug resistance MFS transporter, drug:H+ antiporter-2 family [Cutibacterium modestum HL037PA3]MCP2380926.1 drug:H+ antiporter-2 (14 Spanner) (DHA2) family protein 
MTATAAAPEAVKFKPDRRFWVVYLCLMMVMFLSSLDQTIVATALPTIVGDLSGVEHMAWVITAYTLAITVGMPLYGRLSNLIGRKKLYLIAIGLFLLGSALCGTAGTMVAFIFYRFIQGLGGGGLMILSQAITGDLIPPRVRAAYMAPMGAMFGVSSVLGPLLGGWLTDSISWRWVFWVNLPLGVVAWVACLFALKLPKHELKTKIDWLGLTLMDVGAVAIVLLATWGGSQYDWSSWQIIGLGVVTVVAWGWLPVVERRVEDPVLPLELFHNRTFVVATIIGMLAMGAMFGVLAYLPTYMQMTYGYSATVSGLLLIPMTIGILLASAVTGLLTSRIGRYRIFIIIGPIVAAGGMVLMSTLNENSPVWRIMGDTFVLGLGMGMFFQLLVMAVQNDVRPTLLGTATSHNNFFRQIGVCLGSSLIGVAFTTRLTNRVGDLFASLATSKDPAVLKALGAMSSQNHAAASLTPGAVNQMPGSIRQGIIEAYVNSLTPLFLWMAPMVAAAGLLALLLKDVPLSHHTGLQMRAASEAQDALAQGVPANGEESASQSPVDTVAEAPARRAAGVRKVEAASPRRSAGSDQPAET